MSKTARRLQPKEKRPTDRVVHRRSGRRKGEKKAALMRQYGVRKR